MNKNTTTLQDRESIGYVSPKIKRIITAPRKKIRSKLRGFLPLNLEKFAESLPIYQPLSRRTSGLNPGI